MNVDKKLSSEYGKRRKGEAKKARRRQDKDEARNG